MVDVKNKDDEKKPGSYVAEIATVMLAEFEQLNATNMKKIQVSFDRALTAFVMYAPTGFVEHLLNANPVIEAHIGMGQVFKLRIRPHEDDLEGGAPDAAGGEMKVGFCKLTAYVPGFPDNAVSNCRMQPPLPPLPLPSLRCASTPKCRKR